jgi:hypothetical protein
MQAITARPTVRQGQIPSELKTSARCLRKSEWTSFIASAQRWSIASGPVGITTAPSPTAASSAAPAQSASRGFAKKRSGLS